MITDTQALAEMQAQHTAKAADLAAQIEHQRAEASQARAARLLAHDRAAVERFAEEAAALIAEEAHWKAEWRKAVLADPVISAWIRFRAARWRRTYRQASQEAAIQRTGSDLRPPDDQLRQPAVVRGHLGPRRAGRSRPRVGRTGRAVRGPRGRRRRE